MKWPEWLRIKSVPVIYRKDPIPGVRKYRGGPGCRGIKNVGKKKEIVRLKTDEECNFYHIFPKHSVTGVPDNWDDYWRYPQRCWKKQRKNQYKVLKHNGCAPD